MNKSHRIAIIGAGLGGLTVARILQNPDMSPVVNKSEVVDMSVHKLGRLILKVFTKH